MKTRVVTRAADLTPAQVFHILFTEMDERGHGHFQTKRDSTGARGPGCSLQ